MAHVARITLRKIVGWVVVCKVDHMHDHACLRKQSAPASSKDWTALVEKPLVLPTLLSAKKKTTWPEKR